MPGEAARKETSLTQVAGIILAGGASSRMGREKAWVSLGGKAMIAHVFERIAPQAACVAIAANGDPQRFAAFACPVLADDIGPGCGPLAGLYVGLTFAQARGCAFVVAVPSDAPFLPLDLTARLMQAQDGDRPAIACSTHGEQPRQQPLFSLWPLTAKTAIARALESGAFGVGKLLARLGAQRVQFEAATPDPFFNVNRSEDIETALRWMAQDDRT